jgi:G3E family GTPase
MIGGFLGAGKTTTLARLARRFTDQGRRVGIVTNDQAPRLVDTAHLRAAGFAVEEVAGSCFCCDFGGLARSVQQLVAAGRPDVILAEPVGSCTDLVATVIRPLRTHDGLPCRIAPYAVLVQPALATAVLGDGPPLRFSHESAYIFRKQLEEADLLVLNRIDELASGERDAVQALLRRSYPDREVLAMSARTGEGFERFCAALDASRRAGGRPLEVDYDVYAAGEADLGWLNSDVAVEAESAFELDHLLLAVVRTLGERFAEQAAETAHVKVIGAGGERHGVANLVSSGAAPVLSATSACRTRSARLIVNARVALAPETLQRLVTATIDATARSVGGTATFASLQSFRPGRPVPTYRIASDS